MGSSMFGWSAAPPRGRHHGRRLDQGLRSDVFGHKIGVLPQAITCPLDLALPLFWWSSRPAGCSNVLECRAFVDFSRRPDRELAAGGRAAQNCVCLQRDHSSRTNSLPPKVRESHFKGGGSSWLGASSQASAASP